MNVGKYEWVAESTILVVYFMVDGSTGWYAAQRAMAKNHCASERCVRAPIEREKERVCARRVCGERVSVVREMCASVE